MTKDCCLCAIPSNAKGVIIDERGLCNYCDFENRNNLNLYDNQKYKQLFTDRIESIRNKYNYDALVGISGGKDGVYVLHKLVREYDLKVLAFTYVNEFMSDEISNNIDKIIRIYNVDHFYYKPKNLKSFYRGVIKKLGVPCYACAFAGYYLTLRLLLEKNILFFVHGRTPFQMFRNLDQTAFETDLNIALIKSNFSNYDVENLIIIYRNAYQSISKLVESLPIEYSEKQGIMEEFFSPLSSLQNNFVPESYSFFLTEPYDESTIRRVLQTEAGYTAPSSHEDCKIHDVAGYLTYINEGVSIDIKESATMVRKGLLSKKEFKDLLRKRALEAENPPSTVKEGMKIICKELSLELEEIKGHMSNWNDW